MTSRNIIRLVSRTSYGVCNAVLSAICRSSLLQKTVLNRRVRLIKCVMEAVGFQGDVRKEIRQGLRSNVAKRWRLMSLARSSADEFDRWIVVEGRERLDEALARGKGAIILNSHFDLARCMTLVLDKMGYNVYSLEAYDLFRVHGASTSDRVTVQGISGSFLLKQLYLARQTLDSGKCVHLTGDGYMGARGREGTFLGRSRRFPSSYAELSVATGAVLVPVTARLLSGGRIKIEFMAPWAPPSCLTDRQDIVHWYVTRYVQTLEDLWRAHPGSVTLLAMKQYLGLPPVDRVEQSHGNSKAATLCSSN